MSAQETAYYVEFPNSDVGPFRTEREAESYRQYEGNLEETQVFSSDRPAGLAFIDMAMFCPQAVAKGEEPK